VISLLAGALTVLGLMLLALGIVVPRALVLLAGFGALAGGTAILAAQRRRARSG
jgi:hypothetical protein